MSTTLSKSENKKAVARTQKEILSNLAELGGRLHVDDDITYQGDKLILPTRMTIPDAVSFLSKKHQELEKHTEFTRTFNYRPWDGAYCTYNVFKRTFGAVAHKGTRGMFGPNPPQLITINTNYGEQEQVPWGVFELPFLSGVTFEVGDTHHPEFGPLFVINASGPKKYASEIQGIFQLVEEELETNSMYRGKAFDGQVMPEFMDLSGVDRNQVVYSREVMTQLEVNVWAQLRHTEQFQAEGIPLKRAVLVHGPYGTGKTLAAILTGQEAVANGWTFIKGRPGRDDLSFVMQTARLYQPAVVFYEDVDKIADGESLSDSGISRLLDDFDGIDAKSTRILCVLTTNHPERIHKGMARPGRLDAMIEIDELDMEGTAQLVRCRVAERLAEEIDWQAVFEASQGYKPAFVTEFADRAIRYALVRNNGTADGVQLETEDLVFAAHGLRPQFDVMTDAKDRHVKPNIELALQDTVKSVIRENLNERVLVEENGSGN